MSQIDSRIPEGSLSEKWTNYKAHQKLVNPANKRKLDVIVVGTGLAGASAAASLGEMGFRVVPIRLLHKVVSMRQRTIRTTVMQSIDCFMIRLKEAITVLVRLTFIVWQRSVHRLSTSV